MVSLTMISPGALRKMILGDKYNSTVFREGRAHEIYMVGGYIRDALMGIRSSDRDYITAGDVDSFVRVIREILKGTIVRFGKQNMTRIALKEGLTFDFSKRDGDIRQDLSKRDFTINAMAWSPAAGLTDYFDGVSDIKNKRIRAISEDNLVADPLRMLRAYRFAAEIGGTIDRKTRILIKRLHDKIKLASPERITLELFDLLNQEMASKYLKMAIEDGLLSSILLFPFGRLDITIRGIYALETTYIKNISSPVKVLLNEKFAQNLMYKGLLCLEMLLLNAKYSHAAIDNLRMSNRIRRRIALVHAGMGMWPSRTVPSGDRLFNIFLKSEEASSDLLIIKNMPDLIKEYERFRRIWKRGFLSPEEIIHISKQKGSGIGEVIRELRRAQFTGRIRSKKQAVEMTRKYAINP